MTFADRSPQTPKTSRQLPRRLTGLVNIGLMLLAASSAWSLPNPTQSGPASSDPAGFLDVNGLAPNATPYCASPNYFDFWTFGSEDDGAVAGTTETGPGGVTMTLTDRLGVGGGLRLTAPDHGVIFDELDAGTVVLSQPMFYTQWVFVDIDLNSEGFTATGCVGGDSLCAGGTPVTGVAVMAQNTVFAGGAVSTNQATGFASYNIGPGGSLGPTTIDSRMQIDFLGAVDTVALEKIGSGGAGFAVGGGCEPIGVAKEAGPPIDNGLGGFTIPFTLRVFNNLPDQQTIDNILSAAEAASFPGQFSGPIGSTEIPISNLQITEDLAAVFGSGNFSIENVDTGMLTANPGFNGDTVQTLLSGSDSLAPNTSATIFFDVIFTPPADTVFPLVVVNQVTAAGTAQGVPVQDLSDDGSDPNPASDNGSGGTGDPTVISFPTPPTPSIPIPIPTSNHFGLMLLVLILAMSALVLMKR